MKKSLGVLAVCTTFLILGIRAKGQTPQPSPTPTRTAETRPASDRVLGEALAIDSTNKKISVRTAAGQQITVNVDNQTLYRRIPPGETNIEKAAVIKFADIAIGDRVLARGKLDGDSIQTRILLVVSSSELARSAEQSRADWQRRGISGTIMSLDPNAKEIMVRMRTSVGPFPLRLIVSGSGVRFKRYAPNSIRYQDAIPSAFDQLKVGDYIRALGDEGQDGASLKAEEIVAGSFRMAGGIVTEVNQSTGEVKIKDIQTRAPLTAVISKDSTLRRLPADLLARMEKSMESPVIAQAGGVQEIRVMTPNGPGIRRIMIPPSGGQPGQPPANGQRSGGPGPGGPMRMVRIPDGANPSGSPGSAEDYQETIQKLPAITIADLKPGDGVIVSSSGGGDPSRVTVIMLAAGVTDFLRRLEEAKNARPGYDLDLSLPGLGAQ